MSVSANIATIMGEYVAKKDPRLKDVVSLEGRNVLLRSRGTCHFQVRFRGFPCSTFSSSAS